MARIGIVAAIFIIIVAAIFFGFRRAAKKREGEAAAVTAEARARANATSTTSSESKPAGSSAGSSTSSAKRIDSATYAKLKQQIEQARQRRTASSSTPAPTTSDAPQEPFTKDYIRTQVRELIPLLTECYTKALEEDPKLAGKMVVKFTIGGEPEVGGIVENSEIDPASTITNAGMVECVRETMYGAEFVPPREGVRVEVHYPFEFSN